MYLWPRGHIRVAIAQCLSLPFVSNMPLHTFYYALLSFYLFLVSWPFCVYCYTFIFILYLSLLICVQVIQEIITKPTLLVFLLQKLYAFSVLLLPVSLTAFLSNFFFRKTCLFLTCLPSWVAEIWFPDIYWLCFTVLFLESSSLILYSFSNASFLSVQWYLL